VYKSAGGLSFELAFWIDIFHCAFSPALFLSGQVRYASEVLSSYQEAIHFHLSLIKVLFAILLTALKLTLKSA